MKILFQKQNLEKKWCWKETLSGPEIIENVFKNVSTNPEFEKPEKINKDYSVLDFFAIPESEVGTLEDFLAWVEPRFFSLDEVGCEYFSRLVKESAEIIKKQPYLLLPQDGRSIGIPKIIEKRIKKGFKEKEEVYSFLKQVAKPLPEEVENYKEIDQLKQFLLPGKTLKGAKHLAVCRILSISYVLDHLSREQEFNKFLEYTRFVLGRDSEFESTLNETGILSGLQFHGDLDVIDKQSSPEKILEWLEKGAKITEPSILNINETRHVIPKMEIGIKGGIRTFLKIMRTAKRDWEILDDVFRIRFIFNDDTDKGTIVLLLHNIQEEAKKRENPKINVEFREKNYFSEKELKSFFPKILGKKTRTVQEIRSSGLLDRIIVHKNKNSGEKYKNLSAKISLFDNEKGKRKKRPFFAFEIQFVREDEHRNNEKSETEADHFSFVVKQLSEVFSRINGPMKKEEWIKCISDYLVENVETGKMPSKLVGRREIDQVEEVFELDFSGSLRKRAEIIFDFLCQIGMVQKIDKRMYKKKNLVETQLSKSSDWLQKDVLKKMKAVLEE